MVDVAEAWMLSPRVGETFPAAVLGVRNGHVEVQIQDPPVRAEATREDHGEFLNLGQRIRLKLTGADVEAGKTSFSVD